MLTSAASSSGGQRCCAHSAIQLLRVWLMACRVRAFLHASFVGLRGGRLCIGDSQEPAISCTATLPEGTGRIH